MSTNRRISMNTSLKNARIFDDDSWDPEEVSSKLKIKTEVEDEVIDSICDNAQFGSIHTTINKKDFNIKQEKFDVNSEINNIKQEIDENLSPFRFKCKQEPIDSTFNFNFKQEEVGINVSNRQEFEENTNDSVDSTSNQSRKSTKKSVFKREVPYLKRESSAMDQSSPKKSNVLHQNSDNTKNTRNEKYRKREFETNAEVLARRQKQIDFGKNTIGYDNYIKLFPRGERTSEHPATPNKHLKYSRRAWDGLVKQWRLRLHKYDA